jgi:type IV pilus assembly protein PilW
MRNLKNLQKGFSLAEVLIAMLLGLILMFGLTNLFVQNRASFSHDQVMSRMQEDSRVAIAEIARDISMAGHWADLLIPESIQQDSSLDIGTDCGPAGVANWMYQIIDAGGNSSAITAIDNATAAEANAAFSCIATAEFQAGTDVVSIKGVAGVSAAAPTTNDIYLRTNGTVGVLFRHPMSATPPVTVPVPNNNWQYAPRIYYIRNFATTAGDGIPTLCRKLLQLANPPNVATECIAQGVENLQVEFGLDTSNDGDANVYVSDPTLAQMQTVISARISLLARGTELVVNYNNDKTYSISNAPDYSPADQFPRRVFSTSTTIRNLKYLRKFRTSL